MHEQISHIGVVCGLARPDVDSARTADGDCTVMSIECSALLCNMLLEQWHVV